MLLSCFREKMPVWKKKIFRPSEGAATVEAWLTKWLSLPLGRAATLVITVCTYFMLESGPRNWKCCVWIEISLNPNRTLLMNVLDSSIKYVHIVITKVAWFRLCEFVEYWQLDNDMFVYFVALHTVAGYLL